MQTAGCQPAGAPRSTGGRSAIVCRRMLSFRSGLARRVRPPHRVRRSAARRAVPSPVRRPGVVRQAGAVRGGRRFCRHPDHGRCRFRPPDRREGALFRSPLPVFTSARRWERDGWIAPDAPASHSDLALLLRRAAGEAGSARPCAEPSGARPGAYVLIIEEFARCNHRRPSGVQRLTYVDQTRVGHSQLGNHRQKAVPESARVHPRDDRNRGRRGGGRAGRRGVPAGGAPRRTDASSRTSRRAR